MVLACAGSAVWQGARTVHYHWLRSEGARHVQDTITVTAASNVVWLETDELRYEGRMFDVIIRKRVHEGWVFIGHYDSVDDEIFGFLNRLFDADPLDYDGGENPGVFMPEAVLLTAIQYTARGDWSPPLLYSLSPDEQWRSTGPTVPDTPPEVGRT